MGILLKVPLAKTYWALVCGGKMVSRKRYRCSSLFLPNNVPRVQFFCSGLKRLSRSAASCSILFVEPL
nr:hypothetical protein [Escherichia coli]